MMKLRPEDIVLRLHPHQKLEVRAIGRHARYRVVLSVGGVGSGKTLCTALWMLDRSEWDVNQLHAIFTPTAPNLHGAILAEALPWLEAAGHDAVFGRRPPKEWREAWKREGKRPPTLKRYTSVLTLSTGLTLYCGSFGTKSYRSCKGMSFGSVLVEELAHGCTEEALRFILERLRCGLGRERCRAEHHHVLIGHSNPPDDYGSFLFDQLARWEAEAARKAGKSERASEDTYPCLSAGIGDVLLIQSRTSDNAANLPESYIDDLTASVDSETARRILEGSMVRSREGRVYNGFSSTHNERPVAYHPDRTLLIGLDFNVNPTVALFAHELNPGEYPSEHNRAGVKHVGVFGEYFHVGGQDVSGLAAALLAGDSGSGGHLPKNWRGLLHHAERVTFFGDATSTWQRMAGNEWQLIDELVGKAIRGRYSRNVPDKNPLVPLGVRAVNAKFCSAAGIRSLWVDPRCSQLIDDLANVVWDRTGRDVQKHGYRPGTSSKLWQRGHLSDALRYLISRIFPLGNELSENHIPKLSQRSTLRVPRL